MLCTTAEEAEEVLHRLQEKAKERAKG
jgi:hypothetical protein